MSTHYTLDYFINKFEAIPDDKWTDSGQYKDEDGACCALGHCGAEFYKPLESFPEVVGLCQVVKTELGSGLIAKINDNKDYYNPHAYSHLGSTPKQRILTFLQKIKEQNELQP